MKSKNTQYKIFAFAYKHLLFPGKWDSFKYKLFVVGESGARMF